MPNDKSEGVVKDRGFLCGAMSTAASPEGLRTRTLGNASWITQRWTSRSTIPCLESTIRP